MPPRPTPFVPALIVVDVQNDFLLPTGALSVPDAPTILPTLHRLLSLPFALKIATQENHPPDHVSFAASHPPPHNTAFVSTTAIAHPDDPTRTYTTQLWPVHCVAGTPGAELADGLSGFDRVMSKGTDARIEMYSAFTDPFHEVDETGRYERGSRSVCTSELGDVLEESGVTHLYVVGLATEYCVAATAIDGARFGFEVYVVREGTRAVGGVEEEERCYQDKFPKEGVKVVGIEDAEVRWVEAVEDE